MIGEEKLADLLRLPPGQRVIGFEPRCMTLSIAVHLEGDGLPDVPAGGEPPTVYGSPFEPQWEAISATDPDAIHARLLRELDRPGRLETSRSVIGRRRLLERHQPCTDNPTATPFCNSCRDDYLREPWPCPDYVDAAAGVAIVYAWRTTAPDTLEGDQP